LEPSPRQYDRRQSLASLIPFLRDKYPPAISWPDSDILKYLEWAAGYGFLLVARQSDDSVKGVALARPVASFPETLFEFDLNGRIVHINFLVADSNKAFTLLGISILNRFKECETVTFNRVKNGLSKKKTYSAKNVRKTIFNLRNHHGQGQ
jgi:hypothetical protein